MGLHCQVLHFALTDINSHWQSLSVTKVIKILPTHCVSECCGTVSLHSCAELWKELTRRVRRSRSETCWACRNSKTELSSKPMKCFLKGVSESWTLASMYFLSVCTWVCIGCLLNWWWNYCICCCVIYRLEKVFVELCSQIVRDTGDDDDDDIV